MVKTVLVTGACGFIGKRVVDELLGKYEIIASDHPNANFSELPLEVKQQPADITKLPDLERLVKDAELIINCAGIIDSEADEKLLDAVNHLAVKNMCKYGAHLEKFVQLSSIGVYGIPKENPATEMCKKRPRNNYEVSKLAAEISIRKACLPKKIKYTLLRPAYVYGIGGPQNVTLSMMAMNEKKKSRIFKGPQISMAHVTDVARATVYLLEHETHGNAFNICDDDPLYFIEFLREIAEPFDVNIKQLPMNGLFKALMKAGTKTIPSFVIKKMDAKYKRKWQEFQEEHNLQPGLTSGLSKSWFDYLLHNQVYSNEKIKELGFELNYPTFRGQMQSIVQYYRNIGCLPQL